MIFLSNITEAQEYVVPKSIPRVCLSSIFDINNSEIEVFVPFYAMKKYKKAEGWKQVSLYKITIKMYLKIFLNRVFGINKF